MENSVSKTNLTPMDLTNLVRGVKPSKHPKVIIPFRDRYVKINQPNMEKRDKRELSRQKANMYVLADKVVDRMKNPYIYECDYTISQSKQQYVDHFLKECVTKIIADGVFGSDYNKVRDMFLSVVNTKAHKRKVQPHV
jgi:hypothetical protein